jgi:hypothetical protein
MPETKVEKKQDEQAEAIRKDGLYAATEEADNAIAVSDENYVGVEPSLANYAYDEQKPLAGDDSDEKKIFDRLAEENANLASRSVVTTRRGTISGGTVHPSERGARPGLVQGGNQTGTDVRADVAKSGTTTAATTGENDAAKAEVAKGNTPAPAKD